MIYAQIMAVLFICPVNKFISILCHGFEHLFLEQADEFDGERWRDAEIDEMIKQ